MTTIVQTLSDMAIMGEKYYANALENAGFTEEEAKKMALEEFFLNNPVRNSTTAFVSNAIVSGANSAASGYRKPAEIYEDADETAKLTEGKDSGKINGETDKVPDAAEYKIKSVFENIDSVAKDYGLKKSGYFGEWGDNGPVFKSSDPIKSSADFYKKLSYGGNEMPLKNGHGVRVVFDDGSLVVYRVITKTSGSHRRFELITV